MWESVCFDQCGGCDLRTGRARRHDFEFKQGSIYDSLRVKYGVVSEQLRREATRLHAAAMPNKANAGMAAVPPAGAAAFFLYLAQLQAAAAAGAAPAPPAPPGPAPAPAPPPPPPPAPAPPAPAPPAPAPPGGVLHVRGGGGPLTGVKVFVVCYDYLPRFLRAYLLQGWSLVPIALFTSGSATL